MRKRQHLTISQTLKFKGIHQVNASIKELINDNKMDSKQKSTLSNLALSYNLAKELKLHLSFPKFEINPNLNKEFQISILGKMKTHSEREMKFIPMGMEYPDEKKIEFNSMYSWCNEAQWSMIFWHELAHLIDTNHFSQPYLYEKVAKLAKHSTRYQPINPLNKSILWYFTKPENKKIRKLRYVRASTETFAECFAMIMTLASLGTNEDVLSALVKKNYIIKTYINILLMLIDDIEFEQMGLRINRQKKEKIKSIFKAIHLSEKKFVIKKRKCAKKFQ
jgi:hypothetical protein